MTFDFRHSGIEESPPTHTASILPNVILFLVYMCWYPRTWDRSLAGLRFIFPHLTLPLDPGVQYLTLLF